MHGMNNDKINSNFPFQYASFEASTESLTPKAVQMYRKAEKVFEQYGDYSCELDALDNYYDFLEAADDNLLDTFTIDYNAEPDDEDECEVEYDIYGNALGPGYKDPSVILTSCKSNIKLFITCRGYEFDDGHYIPCPVNENCKHLARECVEHLKTKT